MMWPTATSPPLQNTYEVLIQTKPYSNMTSTAASYAAPMVHNLGFWRSVDHQRNLESGIMDHPGRVSVFGVHDVKAEQYPLPVQESPLQRISVFGLRGLVT